MKLKQTAKILGIAALALGVATGCATQDKSDSDTAPVVDQAAADAERAIAQAKSALKAAQSGGYAWRDTGKLIKKAEEALKAGDYAKAKKIADEATKQSEMAKKQMMAENARVDAEFPPSVMGDSYTVVSGDTLWGISGNSGVYGNSYQWPLLYKANSNKIKDADLIFPGQNLSIDRNASAAEVDRAVQHAKTRGAWSIGVTEQSDLDYLSGK